MNSSTDLDIVLILIVYDDGSSRRRVTVKERERERVSERDLVADSKTLEICEVFESGDEALYCCA